MFINDLTYLILINNGNAAVMFSSGMRFSEYQFSVSIQEVIKLFIQEHHQQILVYLARRDLILFRFYGKLGDKELRGVHLLL
ncbi:MAG: hypothetical protein R2750_02055 [Bacteroidales bacterium]